MKLKKILKSLSFPEENFLVTENFLQKCQECMNNNEEHFPVSAIITLNFYFQRAETTGLSVSLALQSPWTNMM
jgi:hypothetical protein